MKSYYIDKDKIILKQGDHGDEIIFLITGNAIISQKSSFSRSSSTTTFVTEKENRVQKIQKETEEQNNQKTKEEQKTLKITDNEISNQDNPVSYSPNKIQDGVDKIDISTSSSMKKKIQLRFSQIGIQSLLIEI